ncbi:uncharacterized protein LOC113227729 [Hyposmocoma kahamanoa]|uniref:uncharacterized protein LOC113227729 n=1 Tax=Hyposmocoma kahamanoa TaxID=1477025 RepID=UPI000E6D9BF7|nr:uncharacterized protein LOC113227729 [Hyposmocoma kahamanoa]
MAPSPPAMAPTFPTPIAPQLQSPGQEKELRDTSQDDPKDVLTDKSLAYELRAFRLEMIRTREEMKGLRQDLVDLRSTVRACEDRLDKMEETVRDIKVAQGTSTGINPEVVQTIRALEENVERLQRDINERDQDLLSYEVELSCVPEEGGENPIHIVLACAAKLGVQIDQRDLVSCTRVGALRREEGARPRQLAVRLARRDTRDALLRAARVRRHLTTEGLGLKCQPRPIYVNERLTRVNRQLFYTAKQTARRLQWKFVWTKDGRIYVRREAGTAGHRIRSEADLDKIFGPDNVRSPTTRAYQ